jgi:putative copper export protein
VVERTFTVLEAVSLALWVGGLAAFGLFFAPIAFHVLSASDGFSTLIESVLRALTRFGYGCGAVALLSALVQMRDEGLRPLARVRIGLLVAMLAASAFDANAIVPAMDSTAKALNGAMDSIPKDDPRRVKYDAQHRESTTLYGFVVLLGLGAVALAAVGRLQPRHRYQRYTR